MKSFLSNCIGGVLVSSFLRRLCLIAVASVAVMAGGNNAFAQTAVLDTSGLSNDVLVDALTSSFSLDRRLEGGLLMGGDSPIPEKASAEQVKLQSVLHALGYLDGKVIQSWDPTTDTYVFVPESGAQYAVGAVAVTLPDDADQSWASDMKGASDQVLGLGARGEVVGGLGGKLARLVENSGYPFARISSSELVPISGSGMAVARLSLNPGASATFGPLALKDGRDFRAENLAKLAPFSAGDRYSRDKLDELQAALDAVPSLRSARVTTTAAIDSEGQLPVTVTVRERVNPDLVREGADAGRLSMLAVLALLAIRQLTVAAGVPPHSPLGQSQTIATIMALVVAAWFVSKRIASFAAGG